MSAAVNFTFVSTEEVAKMATLAARLGASLEMSRDQESKTQDISVVWGQGPSSETVAALVLMLAAQDKGTPGSVLDHIKSMIGNFGFDPDAQVA